MALPPGERREILWSGVDYANDAAASCTRKDVMGPGRYRFSVLTYSSEEDASTKRGARPVAVDFELPAPGGVVGIELPGP